MKFAFIGNHRSIWPIAWLCEALGISRSGFHVWLNRSPNQHARYDEALSDKINDSFKDSDRRYGARVFARPARRRPPLWSISCRASHARQCIEKSNASTA